MEQYNVTNADIQAARGQNQQQQQAPQKAEPQVYVDQGVQTVNVGHAGGNFAQNGVSNVTTVNAGDLESGYTGVLGTARSFTGAPASKVTDKTQVTLPGGMQTTAAAAAQLGYLVRNNDGSYRNADDDNKEGD